MESSQSSTLAASFSLNAPRITSVPPQTPQTPPPPPQPESNPPETQPGQDEQAESEPQVAKKGRQQSDVWTFCTKVFKKNAKGVMYPWAVCNTCKHEMPAHPKHNGTTGIRNHIERRCTKCSAYKGNQLGKGQSTIAQDSMGAPLVPHTFNQKRHDEKVVRFVIRDEMPFRVVEGVAFKEMIAGLFPKFRIPDRKKVAAAEGHLFACC